MGERYQPYPAYKESGVDWLGDVPTDWTVSKLKYETMFQVGWTPPTKSDANFIGSNLWANISDLGPKFIADTSKRISDIAAKQASMSITPSGSLLYSFKLSVGTVSFAAKDMFTNEAIASFLPNGRISLAYLYYALPLFVIQNASTNIYGARILNQELIKSAVLLAPSSEESDRIAAFLDHETAKIDALIAKQQRLIALLEEKRQAVISYAVTKGLNPEAPLRPSGIDWLGDIPTHWELSRIKHLATAISKGTTPSTVGGELAESGVRFLKAENIGKSLSVSPTPQFYITEQMDEQISRSRLYANDVLVIIAGATTGLASVITDDLIPANTNQAVSFIRPKNSDSSFYILHWLSTDFAQRIIWVGAVQAAQPNLSMEDLGNIPIALPPSNEMEEILENISTSNAHFSSLLVNAQSAITLLKERRTALISAAVTGKIDVRDWTPPEAKDEAA